MMNLLISQIEEKAAQQSLILNKNKNPFSQNIEANIKRKS